MSGLSRSDRIKRENAKKRARLHARGAALLSAALLLTGCRDEVTQETGTAAENARIPQTTGKSFAHTRVTSSAPVIEGSGNRIQESRDAENFDGVVVDLSVDFKIIKAETPKIVLLGDDNVLPLILTEVRDGTLVVSSPHSYATNNKITVVASVPVIRRVSINGSANGFLDSVTEDELDIRIAGSGDLGGKGVCEHMTATIEGSGDLLLHRLRAADCRVTIHGSGNANVYATQSLNATINGSGDITYSGMPKQVNRQVNGSGNVRAQN